MRQQQEPKITLVPRKPAVVTDEAVTLDVLVRIEPPAPEVHFPRPPVNLALVLDRSISMAEDRKMPYAIEASQFAVQQLLPTDRVSVTIFDDEVEQLVPSTLAHDKAGIVSRLARVRPRGSTNLHGGWLEGARQVQEYLKTGGLNRVLLLSDGLTNQGLTDPNAIASETRGLAASGVSTTTMGLGDDYNEDLLESMAQAGGGNYYYIESPVQLADIFTTELKGLMATVGQKVSLGIETGEGVAVLDVLNDFDRLPTGRLGLPNLVLGMPILTLVRLSVRPRPATPASLIVSFRLAWDAPEGGSRRSLHARLDLPAVPLETWNVMADEAAVAQQEALLMAARAQKEAAMALERGDLVGTQTWLGTAQDLLAPCAAEVEVAEELSALDALQAKLDAGDTSGTIKSAKYRSYQRRQGRPNA